MSTALQQYDVFLIHAASDLTLAREIADVLTASGFKVFDPSKRASSGERFDDELREAINESDAAIVVMSPSSQGSQSLFVEVGAASAWEKPIYIVRSGVSEDDLPEFLRHFASFPILKIDELVASLARRRQAEVSESGNDWHKALLQAYTDQRIPVDQLAMDYRKLSEMAAGVSRNAGVNVAPEEVYKQLLRMRKHGMLPRIERRSNR